MPPQTDLVQVAVQKVVTGDALKSGAQRSSSSALPLPHGCGGAPAMAFVLYSVPHGWMVMAAAAALPPCARIHCSSAVVRKREPAGGPHHVGVSRVGRELREQPAEEGVARRRGHPRVAPAEVAQRAARHAARDARALHVRGERHAEDGV